MQSRIRHTNQETSNEIPEETLSWQRQHQPQHPAVLDLPSVVHNVPISPNLNLASQSRFVNQEEGIHSPGVVPVTVDRPLVASQSMAVSLDSLPASIFGRNDQSYYENEDAILTHDTDSEGGTSDDVESNSSGVGLEALSCMICYKCANKARMCPHCSKLFCEGCIVRWLQQHDGQSCPHCRSMLDISKMVMAHRLVDDLLGSIRSLQVDSVRSNEDEQHMNSAGQSSRADCESRANEQPHTTQIKAKCSLHEDEAIKYFCNECKTPACSDCVVLGEHVGHQVVKISELAKIMRTGIRCRIKAADDLLQKIQQRKQSLSEQRTIILDSKDARIHELSRLFSNAETTLELECARKLTQIDPEIEQLRSDQSALQQGISRIKDDLHALDDFQIIDFGTALDKDTREMLNLFNAVDVDQRAHIPQSQLELSLPQEIKPPWSSLSKPWKVTIPTSSMNAQHGNETYHHPLFSPGLEVDGQKWRLKVYPCGNGHHRHKSVSAFVQLAHGFGLKDNRYEYRISLTHAGREVSVREHASEFEEGECWGYNDFCELQSLFSGQVDEQEVDRQVFMSFQIRASSWQQKTESLNWHTLRLSATIASLKTKLLSHARSPRAKGDQDHTLDNTN